MGKSFESTLPSADGGRYIDGDEREEYVDRAMKLLDARFEPKATFGPRWVIQAAMMDSGERVAIALAQDKKGVRDSIFAQVQADIETQGSDAFEPVCLYMAKPEGNANGYWTFRSATAEEIAQALAAEPVGSDDPGELDEAATAAAKRGRK